MKEYLISNLFKLSFTKVYFFLQYSEQYRALEPDQEFGM